MRNISIALALLALCACKDNGDYPAELMDPANLLQLLSGRDNSGGHIFGVHTGRHLSGPGYSYFLNASIMGDEGVRIDGGTATIAGLTVEFDPNSANPGEYAKYIPVNAQTNLPTFGQVSRFALAGNPAESIAGWETTLYIPPVVTITNLGLDAMTDPLDVSRSAGYTVTWNPDVLNIQGLDIYLYYTDMLNQDRTGLPSTSVSKRIPTQDDGSYTLTAADLDGFPLNARFWISLIRENHKTFTARDGRRYYLYGRSKCTGVADLKP